MKKNAIFRIVLFSVITFSLTVVMFVGISANVLKSSKPYTEMKAGSEHEYLYMEDPDIEGILIPAAEIKDIEINWAAGSIIIEPADAQEIVLTETRSGGESMIASTGGSTLQIDYSRQKFTNGFQGEKHLHIAVPRDWNCRKLEINAASSPVRIDSLDIQTVSVNVASGECDFRDCRIGNLQLDGASCDLNYTGTLTELDINGASTHADVHVTNQPKSVSMDSLSGNLVLTLPDDCGFTLSRSSLGGSFTCDFDTNHIDDRYVYGSGDCKIKVDGLSAGIAIHRHAGSVNHSGHDTLHETETHH